MTSERPRYFVDERCGCIAVRDRWNTDPDYPGLHYDTTGIVRYWHGKVMPQDCPCCGTVKHGVMVDPKDKAAAILLCAELNATAHQEYAI
jgi:hypothetical protein